MSEKRVANAVRATAAEWAEIDAAAARAGLSRSEWARRQMLAVARGELAAPAQPQKRGIVPGDIRRDPQARADAFRSRTRKG